MSLPSEYLELKWLGTSGTQYVDTGYKPNGHTEIDVKWYWNTNGTTVSRAMFGVDASWHINSFSQYCDRLFCYGNLVYRADGQATTGNSYYYTYPSGMHHFVFKNQHLNLDGIIDFDVPYQNFSSSYNLWLFAHNRAGNKESSGGMDRIKLYSCTISESGTTVRNFVPCLRLADSKPGLYDTVNGTFYTNKNSGLDFVYEIPSYKTVLPSNDFLVDPITQNSYEILTSIEATQEKDAGGTYGQWIDTELYMEGSERDSITNANDIFEIRGNITELETDGTRWIMGFHNSGRYIRIGVMPVSGVLYYMGADGYWNDGGTSIGVLADTNTHTFVLNHKRNSLSIDGTEYALKDGLNSTNRGTATAVTWRGNTITFLGYKHDSKTQVGGGAKFNIEYIKIYRQNGTVRGNFVPAKSVATGEVGMFDTVNNRFVVNGNTAETAVPFIGHEKIVYRTSYKSKIYDGTNEYSANKTIVNK